MGLEILDGLTNANMFDRGVFLDPGVFTLKWIKALFKRTRKSGTCFIVEFEVVASSSPKHPVGSKATWCQKMQDLDVALGSLKSFLYAVLGFEWPRDKEYLIANVDRNLKQILASAITENEGQKLRDAGDLDGKLVDVQVIMKKTGKGGDFSQHNWSATKKAA